jgi:4-hydroxybenzoate polyprenyltransferase
MMRMLTLAVIMARYRVAVTLLIYFFLGVCAHGEIFANPAAEALASLALVVSYVCATSYNDLADEAIDGVNHPDAPGRPLVSGVASRADLWRLGLAAMLLTLALVIPIGRAAVGWMLLSLAINVAYSLRPLQLSYRTFAAPLLLAVAYVAIPYGVGLSAVGDAFSGVDAVLLAALYLLFLARINLKDFRDRAGDALYGKPTLLLRFGKRATCAVSFVSLALGSVLLCVATALLGSAWMIAAVAVYGTAIALLLRRLSQADEPTEEQACIIVGARLGNGLLTSLLAVRVLALNGADPMAQALMVALVGAAAFSNLRFLTTVPDALRLSYRG